MKIERIALGAIRGLTLETQLRAGRPLLITGPTASGKTTLLESFVAWKERIGAYGAPPPRETFGDENASVTVTLAPEEDERHAYDLPARSTVAWRLGELSPKGVPAELPTLLRDYRCAHGAWKVEYFHAGRSLRSVPTLDWTSPTLRLTKNDAKYGFVRRYLVESTTGFAARALGGLREQGVLLADDLAELTGPFERTLAALTGRLRWVGCERRGDAWRCLFTRPTGRTVELEELSRSEQLVVLVAASYEALGLSRSLVLMDAPEEGIHPEDQVAFVEGLVGLLQRGQLILATTSPALLRRFDQDVVVLKSA